MPPGQGPSRAKTRVLWVLLLAPAVLVAAGWHSVDDHLRAASILLRVQNPGNTGALSSYGTHAVQVTSTETAGPFGAIKANVYEPDGVANAPGLVIVHGVHRLGIAEPRLVGFARALSASGLRVLTPELPGIADYHVDKGSVEVIGAAAHAFRQRIGRPVGLMGLSFSGGLALLAAADPRFASDIGFVVAVGAHHDMGRVSRYLITGEAELPDGSRSRLPAHEYGMLVLVYSDVEHFFSPADAPMARKALRSLLWEQVDEARQHAAKLSPSGREKMQWAFEHRTEMFADQLRKEIENREAHMASVSPRGHLSAIRVPVLLLHGAGDNVIPASETLWLKQEVPPDYLKEALVSRAISHVDLKEPELRDKLALVHFMAEILEVSESGQ